MLYRHFPKIANKDFSILTLSIAETARKAAEEAAAATQTADTAGNADRLLDELLAKAVELGINLVAGGSDPGANARLAVALERTGLRASFTRILCFNGDSPAALEAFLTEARPGGGDLLAIHLENAESASRVAKTGILAAAARARTAGTIGWYGFAAPADAACVTAAIEMHQHWDFFALPCNYLTLNSCAGLPEAITFAGREELGMIAVDPFAGGRLEQVPPAVHELFRNAPVPRSHDEWALRAVWERQETVSLVWEPQNAEQLTRKAIFAEAGRPNSLPSRELDVLARAAAKLAGNQE
jgi:predicted aldo/keto reductase-like oxidoreductase